MKSQGFTLIELLVTMGILGIVMTALFSAQSSTMQMSASTTGTAQRMQALQEASNYVTDRLRSASQVNTNVTLKVKVPNSASPTSPSTETFTCSTAAVASTCFLLVAPDRAGNPQYLVYRIIPRSQLTTLDKRPDSWADSNVLALIEYRPGTAVVPADFTKPIPTSLDLSGVTPNVIVDYLTTGFTGDATTPAVFSFDQTTGQAVLRLQMQQMERGKEVTTPATGPLSMTVYPKNRQ